MDDYRNALSAYLEPPERTEKELAEKIGKSQPAVNRYVNGERWPDADTARLIDKATDGAVPFLLWKQVAMERMGISSDSDEAAAA